MGKSNLWESAMLGLLFKNVAVTLIGDSGGLRASATAGNLYLSLHTASPGETGDQTTNEIGYTSYARQPVARDGVEWTETGGIVTLAVEVSFPKGTGTGGTATYVGIGTSISGAGKLLYYGELAPHIVCGDGITPIIPVSPTSTVTED